MKNFLILLSLFAVVILPVYGDEVWVEPEREVLEIQIGSLEYDKIPEDFECDVTPKIQYDFVAKQLPVTNPDYDSLVLRIGGEDTTKDLQMEISLRYNENTFAQDLSYDISLRDENGTKHRGALYSPDDYSTYSTLGVSIQSDSNTDNGALPDDTRDKLREIFEDGGVYLSYGLPTNDDSYQVYVRVFDSENDWIDSDRCGIQAVIPVDVSQEEGVKIGTIQFSDIKVSELKTNQEKLEEVQQIIENVTQNNFTSVSLDRNIYPVPFGSVNDFEDIVSPVPEGRSLFPVHQSAIVAGKIEESETLGAGDLMLHIRINDASFDVSSQEINNISKNIDGTSVGPLKISVSRDTQTMVLAYAGGNTTNEDGLIDVDDNNPDTARHLGPIFEVAPEAGIFELDFVVRYTDGPASSICPTTATFTSLNGNMPLGSEESRFDLPSDENEDYCILNGDAITVEYATVDESGNVNVLTDTATFELRDAILESDRPAYMMGDDVILTLTEPDLDFDNDVAETYTLDLIEWDSFTARLTVGELGGESSAFDPQPFDFVETGDSTGIFQTIIKLPNSLGDQNLEPGEEIVLEYTDWGPSGAEYVGQEDEDVNLTIFSSEDEMIVGSPLIQGDKEQSELSPLKQIQLGITPSDVECKLGMELMLKHSGEPACVKPSSVSKLIERGWMSS